ncbi:MAG: hypothetical protein GX285_00025, partial [Clostridiales bacterium]|nr:hypothetical protein [Clostridiales bacterium]
MKNKKIPFKKAILYTVLLFVLILIFLITLFPKGNLTKKSGENEWINGITVDDSWYENIELNDVMEGLKNLEIRPTVRIVMSREIEPEEYVTLFKSVSEYADIMACPVDSSE